MLEFVNARIDRKAHINEKRPDSPFLGRKLAVVDLLKGRVWAYKQLCKNRQLRCAFRNLKLKSTSSKVSIRLLNQMSFSLITDTLKNRDHAVVNTGTLLGLCAYALIISRRSDDSILFSAIT